MRKLVLFVALSVCMSASAQSMMYDEDLFFGLEPLKKDTWYVISDVKTGAEVHYIDNSDLRRAVPQIEVVLRDLGLSFQDGKTHARFDGVIVVEWDGVYEDQTHMNLPVHITYAYSVKDLSFHRILLQFLY